jgi:NitT/TauT family transport system substrate-binding protein
MKTSLHALLTRALAATAALAVPLVLQAADAQAQKIKLLLDWAWIPYHSAFIYAREKGYYTDAGLDVEIEQGRGSGTTAIVVGQGAFDIGHLNITNAAHAISKGVPIKTVALYQHKSSASFVGKAEKVTLTDENSLKGLRIGSTPGGSDALSLKIFKQVVGFSDADLNVVSMEGSAKTAALLSDKIDVVSGDSHAYRARVRDKGSEPTSLLLADYGVPLVGFGFAANVEFLENNGDTVRKFLAVTQKVFQDTWKDPRGTCEFAQSVEHIAGSLDLCEDYWSGLIALSQSPDAADWGKSSAEEWTNLVSTLEEVGAIEEARPIDVYYTNDYLP